MTTTAQDPIVAQAREDTIIDADFHVEIEFEDLLPYIDDERIKHKLEVSDPPVPGMWTPAYAYPRNEDTDAVAMARTGQGEALTSEEVRTASDEIAVDVPIVSTGLDQTPGIQNPALKTGICRAFNDYMLDQVVDPNDDIYGKAMIPQWDVEATLAELDRIGDEKGIAGVYGWYGPYRLFGSADYDPVFEKLISLDLPLTLHGSVTLAVPFTPTSKSFRTFSHMIGLMWPFQAMHHVTSMILSGAFDTFPDLDVVILEAGLNWIPFLAHRMDDEYQLHPEDVQLTDRMYKEGRRYLDKSPSEYLQENVYFGSQPIHLPDKPHQAETMLELMSADSQLMFTTDWPHFTFDVPNWTYGSAIDDDMRRNILSGAASDVFRL